MSVNAITNNTEAQTYKKQVTAGNILTPAILAGAAGGVLGATVIAPKKYDAYSLIGLDNDTYTKAVKNIDSADEITQAIKETISAVRKSIEFETKKVSNIFQGEEISVDKFKDYVVKEQNLDKTKIKNSKSFLEQLENLSDFGFKDKGFNDLFKSIQNIGGILGDDGPKSTFKKVIEVMKENKLFENEEVFKIFESSMSKFPNYNEELPAKQLFETFIDFSKDLEKGADNNNQIYNKILESAKDGKIKKSKALDIFKKGMEEYSNKLMGESPEMYSKLEKYLPKKRLQSGLLVAAMTAIIGGSAGYLHHAKKSSE